MLDQGVHAALEFLGFRAKPAFVAEWESYAAAVLKQRMEESTLEPCPIWCGDMADFDGKPWAGKVDLIVAGLPCQPYSTAGKQAGLEDSRSYGEDNSGPMPHFLRIVGECRPALVFLENVPPWVRGGFFRPFGDELCRMGYTLLDPVFLAASDVGASHRRERVFVLAYCGLQYRDLLQRRAGAEHTRGGEPVGQSRGKGTGHLGGSTSRQGRQHAGALEPTAIRCRDGANGSGRVDAAGATLADAERYGLRISGRAIAEQFDERGDGPLFAPGPSDPRWPDILRDSPHLSPAIEPGFRLLAARNSLVVDAERSDQLRCVGNGCVPAQSGIAFLELFRRLDGQRTI
jgi:DNA (cytosine-5)-methyltransferase 1